ncbi:MAG: 23S rRNA (uracil(1939)-C(5))-methyltransferase RlmD, partial [Flavobacteriales bacterium]
MARQRNKRLFKRGERLELQIVDMAFGGKGIAKITSDEGEFIVFVANTLTGQTVEAAITKCKKRYAEARLERLIAPSPEEIDLPYQDIPGAPFAHWPIHLQEQHKQASALHLFRTIGEIEASESKFDTFISSPETWHYRNKMEYSFSAIRWDQELQKDVDEFALGFKKRGTWWMVENLNQDSGLFDMDFENKLKSIRDYLENTGLPPWHPPKKSGFFRHLVVRKSFAQDQLLVMLVCSSSHLDQFDVQAFSTFLQKLLGKRLAGFLFTLNDEIADRTMATTGKSELIYGEDFLCERLCGLEFQMKMPSFFQTNPKSAEQLYSKTLDYVFEDVKPDETSDRNVILDLFCGTGTISQCLAQRKADHQKVIGVELVKEAVEDAIANAKRNQIESIDFYANDVGKFLLDHPEYKNRIDCVIMDPPRAGIAPKTLKKVIQLDAQRMVYVSCNPATQARDLKQLQDSDYKVVKFSFVDQ